MIHDLIWFAFGFASCGLLGAMLFVWLMIFSPDDLITETR